MTCPMGYTSSAIPFAGRRGSDAEDEAQKGFNAVKHGGTTYCEYLQLDKLLSSQNPLSFKHNPVDDEHLFIIIHQAYELWFKQILFDLDAVMSMFRNLVLDESESLKITSKLERIVKIMNLLCDQMMILETMSPLDFIEFRTYLTPASGFQSLQFRLLENKLGVRPENRTRYNAQHYAEVFKQAEDRDMLLKSETDPSLLTLVEAWLGRTPGINTAFKFWPKYCLSVRKFLNDSFAKVDEIECPLKREQELCEVKKLEESYESILNSKIHESYIHKGSRRLNHEAMQGALMIFFYRDMPRFSQPYQILTLLMDLDSLMERWRHNHVILVQRMLGTKQGTGGSSGYMYLRSTCSDRYKVFLDLFNLSTWLIPRCYIPKLSRHLERKLSYFDTGFFTRIVAASQSSDKCLSSGDNLDEDGTSDSDFAE